VSHDPDPQSLPNVAAKWANRRSSRLLHELLRSGGVSKSEGPTSLEGSAGGSGDVTRGGVDEVGGVVAVRGASGPWGRPRGPMETRAVRHSADDHGDVAPIVFFSLLLPLTTR
jgi:hypothetical protein